MLASLIAFKGPGDEANPGVGITITLAATTTPCHMALQLLTTP